MRAPRSLAPLGHPGFRLLACGQLASNIGDAAYAVALPWYVLAGHGGVVLLGTVLAAYGIPRTVLVAAGGHASDRFGPWTVMMAADVARTVAVCGLALVAATGPAHAVLLVPVAALLGLGEGLFLPASFAIMPSLLPGEQLQAGNALASGGTQLAALIGPGVGGAAVALLGPASAFGIDAASFAVSAVTLAGLRPRRRPVRPAWSELEAGRAPSFADEGEGDPCADPVVGSAGTPPTLRRLVGSERALQVILLVTVVANLGSGGTSEVALPVLVRNGFHTTAGGYGGLLAAFGAGALLGTLVAGQGRQARRPAIWASAAFLIQAGFLAAVPFLGGVYPAAAALAAFGALNGFGNIVAVTTFQRWAPNELLGRLMSLLLLASFGLFPLSVLLGGIVVHDLGAPAFFVLAATTLAAAVLAGLTQPAWRAFGAIEDSSSERSPRHATRRATRSRTPGAHSLAGARWPHARPGRPGRVGRRRGDTVGCTQSGNLERPKNAATDR